MNANPAVDHDPLRLLRPEAGDAALLSLARRSGLMPDLLPVGPVFVALARETLPVGAGVETVTYVGKGFDPADAVRGAIGEMAEFRAWLYDPARHATVPGDADGPPWIEPRVEGEAAATAVSLRDRRPGRLPAHRAFGRFAETAGAPQRPGRDSTGCAAGRSRGAAELAGLLETIERDATALWWTLAARRPAWTPVGRLAGATNGHAAATRRRVHFLDLTTDLMVPVVACVTTEPDGTLPALGVACRLDPAAAAEAAFLEAVVSELAIASLSQRLEDGGMTREADLRLADWYERVDTASAPWLLPDPSPSPTPLAVAGGVEAVGARLSVAGLEGWAIDLAGDGAAVPVVKVVVPDLADLALQVPPARLSAVIGRGWRSALPAGFDNPWPLAI